MPGGVRCAVAICHNNCKINPDHPDKQIIFHRFPKDKNVYQVWVQKCRRQDKINVKYARVCSEHFTEDDYIRDLQAELLGLPPAKRLKPTAVPTLKLFDEHGETTPQSSRRKKRFEATTRKIFVEQILAEHAEEMQREANVIKEIQFQIQSWSQPASEISNVIKQEQEDSVTIEETQLLPLYSPARTETHCKIRKETCGLTYEELLRKYDKVVTEKEGMKRHIQLQSQLLDQSKIKIKDLEKEVYNITSKFQLESAYRSQLDKAMRRVFSKEQLKVLTGQKRRIVWSSEDMTKAFTIRNFSKDAYIYLKDTLKFPLPGISSLQRWALQYKLKQGDLTTGLESGLENDECNGSEDDCPEVFSIKDERNSDELDGLTTE